MKNRSKKTGFELVEHPADLSLRAWGSSLEDLFAQCAQGLLSLLFSGGVPSSEPQGSHKLVLNGADKEELLVVFLNEILYQILVKQLPVKDVVVHEVQCCADSYQLEATLQIGLPLEIQNEIKATTYSGLHIREEGDGFAVQVVFDV